MKGIKYLGIILMMVLLAILLVKLSVDVIKWLIIIAIIALIVYIFKEYF